LTNPKLVLHNSLIHLLISINRLLESVSICPKVIPISVVYCNRLSVKWWFAKWRFVKRLPLRWSSCLPERWLCRKLRPLLTERKAVEPKSKKKQTFWNKTYSCDGKINCQYGIKCFWFYKVMSWVIMPFNCFSSFLFKWEEN